MSRKMYRTLAVGALIAGIGRMFRFRARKVAGGIAVQEGDRAKHWRRHDGHKHPWFSHHRKWADEADAPAENDADAERSADPEGGPAEVVI